MSDVRYEPSAWSLDDLLPAPHGPELDRILADLETTVAELEANRDYLSPDIPADRFVHLVELMERIATLSAPLASYGRLWFSGDTQNQDALAFRGRMEKLLAEIKNRVLFFDLWWKGLDDGPAERLLAVVNDDLRYYLESQRRFRPHTLSEAEEKVINIKDINGVHALRTLYDMITNGYTFEMEVEGEIKHLTRSEITAYIYSPSPDLRAAAYRSMYRVYGGQAPILGQIYQHIVRDWAGENLVLRRFASPIAVRNLANDIPDHVVDTLLTVCRENTPLFRRYFRLKAGWLGMDKLRRYDIYAPVGGSDPKYTFDEAVHMTLDSLNDFAPILADHARRVLDENHLDSEIRPRKESGAFCASVLPGLTPWVLVNFTGQARDVATLAHELGHAVHSMMAQEHSPLTFHASLPLAETASVFSEMLLMERLLNTEQDRAVRRSILTRFVDNAYATVQRQAFFVLFERVAHRMIESGATTDDLAEHYFANLQEQFGDALELNDEFRWEWTSIPHIYHVPFYCYAYAFGQLLVLALFRRYKEEEKTFIPRYLNILSYGGSAGPAHILGEAGFDMADPAFWQGGFDMIAEMIARLEEPSAD